MSERRVGEIMKRKEKKLKMKSINYPVGDFLIRVKNASLARRKTVDFPANKFVAAVAECLVKERYLDDAQTDQGVLRVSLSYRKKEPMITAVKLVSKPGLRVYMKVEDLVKIKSPSILILSTPDGIMSSREAIKKKLGGEVIVKIL